MQVVQENHNRNAYEWKSASVTIAGTDGDTDLSGQSGFTGLFTTLDGSKPARYVKIIASATAYIRFNSATADKITVDASNPIELVDFTVTDIFASTGGSAVTLTVTLL